MSEPIERGRYRFQRCDPCERGREPHWWIDQPGEPEAGLTATDADLRDLIDAATAALGREEETKG